MAKKTSSASVGLTEIDNEVARRADTEGLQINVVEAKRGLACFFDVLEAYPPAVAFDLIAKGLKRASGRCR